MILLSFWTIHNWNNYKITIFWHVQAWISRRSEKVMVSTSGQLSGELHCKKIKAFYATAPVGTTAQFIRRKICFTWSLLGYVVSMRECWWCSMARLCIFSQLLLTGSLLINLLQTYGSKFPRSQANWSTPAWVCHLFMLIIDWTVFVLNVSIYKDIKCFHNILLIHSTNLYNVAPW